MSSPLWFSYKLYERGDIYVVKLGGSTAKRMRFDTVSTSAPTTDEPKFETWNDLLLQCSQEFPFSPLHVQKVRCFSEEYGGWVEVDPAEKLTDAERDVVSQNKMRLFISLNPPSNKKQYQEDPEDLRPPTENMESGFLSTTKAISQLIPNQSARNIRIGLYRLQERKIDLPVVILPAPSDAHKVIHLAYRARETPLRVLLVAAQLWKVNLRHNIAWSDLPRVPLSDRELAVIQALRDVSSTELLASTETSLRKKYLDRLVTIFNPLAPVESDIWASWLFVRDNTYYQISIKGVADMTSAVQMDAMQNALVQTHIAEVVNCAEEDNMVSPATIDLPKDVTSQWTDISLGSDRRSKTTKLSTERLFAFSEIPLFGAKPPVVGEQLLYRVVIEMKKEAKKVYLNQALTYAYLIARYRVDVLQEKKQPILIYAIVLGHSSFYLQKLIMQNFECTRDHRNVPPKERNLYMLTGEYSFVDPKGNIIAENLQILKGFFAKDYYQTLDESMFASNSQQSQNF